MRKVHLTNKQIYKLAVNAAQDITAAFSYTDSTLYAWPIPRGGVPALYALMQLMPRIEFADSPEEATFFFDDIIDSGRTMEETCEAYPNKPFFALVNKLEDMVWSDTWVVFPWEGESTGSIENNIVRLLQYVGEDPSRTGLLETPHRVAKAWEHWCSGYGKDPAAILKTFEDGAENYDEMVIVNNIPLTSTCEHHMCVFAGYASIAYIPNGKVVGLSKIPRLLEIYAKRLQVQERITQQVTDALMRVLNPRGAACVIEAEHFCMSSRGVKIHGASTVTSSLKGVFRELAVREEFFKLARFQG